MAKVYDIGKINLPYFDKHIDVITTQNEWIANADEIHRVRYAKTDSEKYVLVERFLTSKNNPTQTSSIRGRKFSQDECAKIEHDIASFLGNASEGFVVQININDGDVVWNGTNAVVVAIS